MSSIRHLVVHWPRLGPYHLARLRGAHEFFSSRKTRISALEIAGQDRTYGWRKEEGETPFQRSTIFPEAYYDDLPKRVLRDGIFSALDRLNPEGVAINGYAFGDSEACLDWCHSRGRKAILMTETTSGDKRRAWVRELAKRVVLRRFSSALCGGRLHRDYLISLGYPAHRIFDKYDVVDNDHFARAAQVDERNGALPGLESGAQFFLASNRFVARKNLRTLLTAYQRYRVAKQNGWRLVLLGSGEEEAALRRQVEEERIPDVSFAGFRQIDELPRYYHAAGCFVHPALSEPWGLVVNEAMASGLPVIVSSGVGCAPDLVEHGGNGFVFDPRDPDALADAMTKVSSDPAVEAGMRKRSRTIIAQWTPAAFAESLWSAFVAPDEPYRVVKFGRRKLLAYRAGARRSELKQIRRVETFTLRREIFSAAVRAAIITRASTLLFPSTTLDNPTLLPTALQRGLMRATKQLGDDVDYTLMWPSDTHRGRVYSYASRRSTHRCVFVKLARDSETAALKNDFNTLEQVASTVTGGFRVPQPIAFGSFRGITYHVTECVGGDFGARRSRSMIASAEEITESYGARIKELQAPELQQLTWMRLFWDSVKPETPFSRLIRYDQQFPVRVRRVHGDLTVANLIRSDDAVWIMDWEFSAPDGPYLTDIVTFFVGNRQRGLSRNSTETLRQFRQAFIARRSETEARDARLALAYLYAVKSGLGRSLIAAWNALPND